MDRKQRGASQRNGKSKESGDGTDIYGEMLAEAGVSTKSTSSLERPLKRRRPGNWPASGTEDQGHTSQNVERLQNKLQQEKVGEESDEDENIEFQDVTLPEANIQTMERDTDEECEDEDILFEDVDLVVNFKGHDLESQEPKELELNLSAQRSASQGSKPAIERRKPITKEERERRINIHKTHLLCLLHHVARRNHWCNDSKVQDSLRPHLTDKMIQYLTPGTNLSQFGRTESLKNGLKMVTDMWKSKFEVRERGLRRPLWAEEVDHLNNYESPSDMESCLDREDFREAAKKLQGSRDIGAQLYCAMLRSIGVRARLVCSLQPLLFVSGGPTLPKPKEVKKPSKSSKAEEALAHVAKYKEMVDSASTTTSPSRSTARRRLGHPNATAYRLEATSATPVHRPIFETPNRIRESPYPIYWVEILDVGHQKWQPTDPVVTHTFWKPKAFEPPITDKENCLCYVVGFDRDGTAKDITRRYAKSYTAKTRKLRIESALEDGERWWGRVMKLYRSRSRSDLDEIEDNELLGAEVREPMPRNVQDFKDHPVYALERHLRRHEVFVPEAKPSGTVSAGSRGPLEKVYRRRDVRVARSVDKWYRLGREVKPNEIPAKWLPKRTRAKNSRFDEDRQEEDLDGDAGTPVYTMDQTEMYEPPPVRNGRVPKNKFGNIEVYVPSMIPKGGVHVVHQYARKAAYLLAIDYAPALTGFEFKGRHGTAVLLGVVVAKEYEDAVLAVTRGLEDLEQEVEDERKRLVALKLWRRFMMGLRIRERIWSGVSEEERREADKEAESRAEMEDESDATEEFDMVVDEDDDGGGGFLIE